VATVTKLETERLRILIVDDHTTFSDLLAGALDREPDLKSVRAAKPVASAVTMYQDLRPDVVIMDLYLPDGSGLRAAEATPVVFWIWAEAERHALANARDITQRLADNVVGPLITDQLLAANPPHWNCSIRGWSRGWLRAA
jgi:chemotaxis response regulator CheB